MSEENREMLHTPAPNKLLTALATIASLASLASLVSLGACDHTNPAEVRTSATSFPVIAQWSATALPAGSGAVTGTLAVKQYAGFRLDASLTLKGAPGARYQWRIFRGDCSTTAVATVATAPTGLLVFATLQSYPDIKADASGTGTADPSVAGVLDSLTAYSVRVRVAQTSTNWDGTKPIACGNLQRSPAS